MVRNPRHPGPHDVWEWTSRFRSASTRSSKRISGEERYLFHGKGVDDLSPAQGLREAAFDWLSRVSAGAATSWAFGIRCAFPGRDLMYGVRTCIGIP